MPEALSFTIHPAAETVTIGLFERAIQDVRRLIRDVDYAVTHETTGHRWVIAGLHSSAPTIEVRPLADGTATLETLTSGLSIIGRTEGTELPFRFTDDALDDLRRMRRLFQGRERAGRVTFATDGREIATISRDIDRRVERLLSGSYSALGSIEGMLEAINLHRTGTFTVWDRMSAAPVRCSFPKDPTWTERVKALLQRRVLVTGRVSYFRSGVPRSVTELRALEGSEGPPPSRKAHFGSIPDLTRGEESVSYLRRQRE